MCLDDKLSPSLDFFGVLLRLAGEKRGCLYGAFGLSVGPGVFCFSQKGPPRWGGADTTCVGKGQIRFCLFELSIGSQGVYVVQDTSLMHGDAFKLFTPGRVSSLRPVEDLKID